MRENGGATYQRANPTIRAALSVERRLHSTHTATGATNSTAAPNTQNTLVTSAAVQLTQFCTQTLYLPIVCWLVKANPQTKLPTMAVPKLGFLPKTTTSSTTIATVVCAETHRQASPMSGGSFRPYHTRTYQTCCSWQRLPHQLNMSTLKARRQTADLSPARRQACSQRPAESVTCQGAGCQREALLDCQRSCHQ